MEFRIGASLFGRYKIRSMIGQGGFAVVYSGWDEWEKKDVAIKILSLSQQASEPAKQRFSSECKILVELSHPNIISVFESQTLAGNHILVMEYCPLSIKEEIASSGKLSVERSIKIGESVCNALEVLHRKGMVHRDVKPSNILITTTGIIKLSDFGITHIPGSMGYQSDEERGITAKSSAAMTAEGSQPGTLLYMSPEQLLGKPANQMSDIYSLGALLYEMLTGESYLGSINYDNINDIVRAILKVKPIPLRKKNKTISTLLEKGIMKALEKNPERRFENITKMREAFLDRSKPEPFDLKSRLSIAMKRGLSILKKKKAGNGVHMEEVSKGSLGKCARGHGKPVIGCSDCIKYWLHEDVREMQGWENIRDD